MKVNIDPNIDKDLLLYVTENVLNKTPPDLFATEIGDEIYFPIIIEDNDIFYHGTSELMSHIIKEFGLCAPKITGLESTHGVSEIFENHIYVTVDKNQADMWAYERSHLDNSPPIILEINGKDINDAGCKAFIDPLYFTSPITSILLKDCNCIKVKE